MFEVLQDQEQLILDDFNTVMDDGGRTGDTWVEKAEESRMDINQDMGYDKEEKCVVEQASVNQATNDEGELEENILSKGQ